MKDFVIAKIITAGHHLAGPVVCAQSGTAAFIKACKLILRRGDVLRANNAVAIRDRRVRPARSLIRVHGDNIVRWQHQRPAS